MADLEQDGLTLENDGASAAVIEHDTQESVGGAVREAYERAREVAEAGDDPDKLEQIRVKRGNAGRFERAERDATGAVVKGPKGEEKAETPAAAKAGETPAVKDTVAKPDAPLSLKPPPGWSAQARTDFARLPLHVQQAVAQREVEVNKGFERLRDYAGIEEHLPRIQSSGLTAAQFVKNAVQWEDSLKSNPVATLMHAAKAGKVDMIGLSRAILQRAGVAVAGAQPGQRQAPQPQPANIQALVRQEFTQRDQQAAQQRATTDAQAFLDDPKNVHAEAVIDDMVALISSKRAPDLKTAYDMAIWARPDIRAELIKQRGAPPSNGNPRRTVDQARAAAKATVGAPNGTPPAARAPAPPKTVRDAVRQAYARAQDAD